MKRGFPRDHQSGGPLVTNHLLDLDMELELLKRKRLMIERQQQLLSDERSYDQQPYQHSQPQYDQLRSYDRNFSHLYDDGRQGAGRSMDSQYGVNYQPVRTNWELRPSDQYAPQPADNRSFPNRKTYTSKPRNSYAPPTNHAPNKNFNQQNNKASKGSFNNTQNTSKGSFNNTQSYGKGPFKNGRPFKYVPPSRANKTGPVRKDFNPTKVTKAKNKATNNAPNKLSSKPVEVRKALVEKAAPFSKEKNEHPDWVLVADRRPSAKVLGRMEFVLGTLVKELREKHASFSEYFENNHYLRHIKNELRLRIRKVLLGKAVPQVEQIHILYRSEFPVETDKSLLDICRALDDTEKLKDVKMKFLPEADPEKFFKTQFHGLFSRQMNKIYNKLFKHQITEADKSLDDLIAELPDIFVRAGADDEANETNEEGDKDVEDSQVIAAEPLEERDSTQENLENNEPIKESSEQTPTKDTQEKPDNNESIKESSEQTPTEETNIKQEEIVSENTDKQESNTASDVAIENGNDSKEGVADSKVADAKTVLKPKEKFQYYRKLIDKMIEIRLPQYLFTKKDLFLKCLDLDVAYRTARCGVLMEANRMAEELNKLPPFITGHTEKSENKKKNESQKKNDNQNKNQIQKDSKIETILNQTVHKANYFVKVVGKPSLPDKKVMKIFIDTFNPKTIKKHKQMHNLLFIGFSSEADMEKMLSADGTTVGNKKLTIKRSGKILETQNNETQNDDSQNTSANLDQEINNLLSNVRNSTEGKDSTKEESEFDKDGDVEMTAEGNETSKNADENVDANEADLAPIKEEGESSINTENATGDISKNTENVAEDEAINTESATADVESSKEPTNGKESDVDTPKKGNAETEVINEKVEAVKEEVQSGRVTPTRASSRLGNVVTPSTVRTRRASKLAQNN